MSGGDSVENQSAETVQPTTEPGIKPSIIQEGKAKVAFYGEVFYNPVQEFNRDLTVTVLRQFVKSRLKEREEALNNESSLESGINEPLPKKKKLFRIDKEDGSIRIIDALSASGLRALRFSQEVPNVEFVLANDFSENAVESIKRNIELNGVQDKVQAHYGDAVMTMMSHRNIDKRFHAVDLDPYGSASVFLDSAVQCVADRGLLMVTCTDMAVLCGNTPEACYNKYDAVTVRAKCCHEMALRILIRSMDSHANRYNRYVEPLVAISIDFYVRVFVRVHTGARECKESPTKVGSVLVCSGCHSMEVVPMLKKVVEGKSVRFTAPSLKQQLIDGDNKCVHCGHAVQQAGPMYTGPIHNKEFVSDILKSLRETPEGERLGTHSRLLGVLTNVSEELEVPLYYEHDQLANVVKCPCPKASSVRSAILNAGYDVSGSHCNPRALKTNAPPEFLWDITRAVAKQSNVKIDRLDEKSPGRAILAKPAKNEVDFKLHPAVAEKAKTDNMIRFQVNRGKNFGPRAKAKGSVNSAQAGFQASTEALEK